MESDQTQKTPKTVLGTAPQVDSVLEPLIDKENDFIVLGRTRGEHSEFGNMGLMDIGVVGESQSVGENHLSRRIMMDSQFPHIMFICGKRGSGKSYTLGIIAEELAKSSEGIGTVLIDPIGIFWSLKRENVSEKELQLLGSFGLKPMGFENVRVLTPLGYEDGMEAVIDDSFAIGVSEMSASDWCTVFDLDRFKAQGLLISDAVDKVRDGYIALYGSRKIEMTGKADQYSIGDIIQCIEHDEDFQSKKKGYASQTRRSIAARFHAVGNWGLFSMDGTPINVITSPNMVTVIDVSHPKLDNDKRALIAGLLARKILEGRIQASKREEAWSLGMQVSMEGTIPVTWLLIDEAHLILPRIGGTPASAALVEYAKLGRKPGCGLVLATQRPAATNDGVLSQVDMMISHNLALEEDMKSLRKRMPSKVPQALATSDFIRAIPVGMGLVADQKTQNRTMLVKFRPRQSYHSGKAAVPTAIDTEVDLGGRKFRARAIPKFRETPSGGSILSPSLNIDKLLIRIDSPKQDNKPIFVVRGDDLLPKVDTKVKKKEEDPDEQEGTVDGTEEGGVPDAGEEATDVAGEKEESEVKPAAEDPKSDGGEEGDAGDTGKEVMDGGKGHNGEDEATETGKEEPVPEKDRTEDEPERELTGADGADTTDGAESREPDSDGIDEHPAMEIPEMMRDVLHAGRHYMFKNADRTMARRFARELTDQCNVLFMVISRSPATRVKAVFEDRPEKVFWLSKTGRSKCLNPHNLEKITFNISRFLQTKPGSLVYFDGLEYLISNNDFQKVMRFIETVHEKSQMLDGAIVYPFTPEVISKREMIQLQTEMDVVLDEEDLLPFDTSEREEGGDGGAGEMEGEEGKEEEKREGGGAGEVEGAKGEEEEKREGGGAGEVEGAEDKEEEKREGGGAGEVEGAKGKEEEKREGGGGSVGEVEGAEGEGGEGTEEGEKGIGSDSDGVEGNGPGLANGKEKKGPDIPEDPTEAEWESDDEAEEKGEDEIAWEEDAGTAGDESVCAAESGGETVEGFGDPEDGEHPGEHGNAVPDEPGRAGLDTEYYDHLFGKEWKENGEAEAPEEAGLPRRKEPAAPGTGAVRVAQKPMKEWPENISLHGDYREMAGKGNHVSERDVRTVRVPEVSEIPLVDAEFTDIPVGGTLNIHREETLPSLPRKQKVVAPAQVPGTVLRREPKISGAIEKPRAVEEPEAEQDEYPFMEEGQEHLIILPNLGEDEVEAGASRYLKSEGLFSRKKIEMVSGVKLTFIPLYRLTFTKRRYISRKLKEINLFFDAFTGELVKKYHKGLRRTLNMNVLFKYPKTQVRVLLVMRNTGALNDFELKAKTELRNQDLRKALNALEKEGIVRRQVTSDGFYKYKRNTEISIPAHIERAVPDLPYIREGKLIVDVLSPRFREKEVETLIRSLNTELDFVDTSTVYYPYYIVSVEGKRGPRNIFIDGISGELDELLGIIKKYDMGMPE